MKKKRHHVKNRGRGGKPEQIGEAASEVDFDFTEMKSELMKRGWGKDILTNAIEDTFCNIGVSFIKLKPYFELSIKAGEIFKDAAILLSHKTFDGLISTSLFSRANGCFLGAVRLSFSSQITETWALLRVCLENSLYAFYIAANPEAAKVWAERHNSEAHKKNCRNIFATGNMLKALKAKSLSIAKEARDCQNDTIDWGAHPNERSLFSNLELKKDGSGYNLNIFKPDEAFMRHSICAVLSTVSLVFKIFALIYPEEFKQPNLVVKINNLNKQIQPLFFAAYEGTKDKDKVAE